LPSREGGFLDAIDQDVADADIGPGSRLGGRYDVVSVLGASEDGVVYKALDLERDDFVALKILSSLVGADELQRFKRDIKIALKVRHDNVVRAFDTGKFASQSFVSMEYVRGLTLRYLLDQTGRMSVAAGLLLARQLAAGLAAAHAEGLIHGAIRSRNIIVGTAGDAKLMDLGLAATAYDAAELEALYYAAPELLSGEEASQAADHYAFGVVLYELFTGRKPFTGKSASEVSHGHLHEPPVAPSSAWSAIPPGLEKLILRLLEKNPSRRVSSSDELCNILDGISS
jgi:serine/threonine-protein kinase